MAAGTKTENRGGWGRCPGLKGEVPHRLGVCDSLVSTASVYMRFCDGGTVAKEINGRGS